MKALLLSLLLLGPMPATWTNCDVGPDHVKVSEALRVMDTPKHRRQEQALEEYRRWNPRTPPPAFLMGVGQLVFPGTTVPVLSEQLRGSTAGSVSIPDGQTTGVEFFFVSAAWATTPGITVTVTIDRSYDGGVSWVPYAGNQWTTGSLIPVAPKTRADGMPFIRFTFDGVASIWRWSIVPSSPFVWGASATF